MIALVDYGMGNLKSVFNAFNAIGRKVVITSSSDVIASCNKVVLPGVGAFGDAMRELKKRNLVSVLKQTIDQKKPFLGICLGLQLLFEKSDESTDIEGLSIFRGIVKRFVFNKPESPAKIPHMGWNTADIKKDGCPLTKDIPNNAFFYFLHSYYIDATNTDIGLAITEYGNIKFSSMIWKDNVFAAQFHPEKSQEVGLNILGNFVKI